VPRADSTGGLHEERRRDGSLRARGRVVDGQPGGHREWFRLDGTRLRSGWFDRGRATGEWTTHDTSGAPYETTIRG
jgi:hypothetical protein